MPWNMCSAHLGQKDMFCRPIQWIKGKVSSFPQQKQPSSVFVTSSSEFVTSPVNGRMDFSLVIRLIVCWYGCGIWSDLCPWMGRNCVLMGLGGVF